MALPALSRAYSVRRDCLLPDRSSILAIQKSHLWALKAHLMDQIAVGSTGPTARAPASVWTCLGSSDGVAGGLDAVDRWGSSFDASKLVFANDGVAHSWIVLENAALGVQLVIDLQSSAGQVVFAFTPIAAPFSGGTGGTVTNRPFRNSHEVNYGYTSVNVSNWISGWSPDTALSANQRSQFLCAADGSFLFFITRDGLGVASCSVGIVNPLAASWFPKRGADTNAVCFIGSPTGSTSQPGAFGLASWATASATAQRLPNGTIMTQGGICRFAFGGTNFDGAAAPADPITFDFTAVPLAIHTLANQALPRGVVPDFYAHANRTLIPTGEVNDPGGTVSHLALGDLWIPWDGPAPTI